MKREDFVNITEEHRKICEEVLGNIRNNCKDIECDNCMFDNNNSSNNKCCTDNQYSNPISQTYEDKPDILFVESCKLFLKTFFNVTEKEEVLKIESQEVFDSVAFRIVYQNEEVLKRGEFKDYKINVFSAGRIGYYDIFFYIRGSKKDSDSEAFVVSKEVFKDIENKVRMINEKYGIKKEWRAEKGGEYFYVNYCFKVCQVSDLYTDIDNNFYTAGNYFKTREEAKKMAEKFKKVIENAKVGNI